MSKEEPDEVLEPLFDYARVQPINVFVDDDDDVVPLAFFPGSGGKRKRSPDLDLEGGEEKESRKVVILADSNNNDKENKEEDWMPLPPPLISSSGVGVKEDKILEELRLRKQELALFAQPTEDMLKAVVESAKRDLCNSAKTAVVLDVDDAPKPERQRILISIQDKGGQKPFRMYTDDKLDKLFKMYTEKVNLEFGNVVFCFDGDRLSPNATPASAGLENDDIIEVHVKSQ